MLSLVLPAVNLMDSSFCEQKDKKNRVVPCTIRSVIQNMNEWKTSLLIAGAACAGPWALTTMSKLMLKIGSYANPMLMPYIQKASFREFTNLPDHPALRKMMDAMPNVSLTEVDAQLPLVLKQLENEEVRDALIRFMPALDPYTGEKVCEPESYATYGPQIKLQDQLLVTFQQRAQSFQPEQGEKRSVRAYTNEALRWKAQQQRLAPPFSAAGYAVNRILIDTIFPFVIRFAVLVTALRVTRMNVCAKKNVGKTVEDLLEPSKDFMLGALALFLGTIVADLLSFALARLVIALVPGLALVPQTIMQWIEPVLRMAIRVGLYALVLKGVNSFLDYKCCSGAIECELCPQHTLCLDKKYRDSSCDLLGLANILPGPIGDAIKKGIQTAKFFTGGKTCCDAADNDLVTGDNQTCIKATSDDPQSVQSACIGNTCWQKSEEDRMCSKACPIPGWLKD